MNVIVRVNAGALAADHWLNDPQTGGGRLLGEGYLEGGGVLTFLVLLIVQGALVVCCALPGLLMVLFGDRGFGIGLLIGWALGVATLVLLAYLMVVAVRTV